MSSFVSHSALRAVRLAALFILILATAAAHAAPSNKWRLQFSGKANVDGVIEIKLTPEEGEAITATVDILNNTGENGVAAAVVKSLKGQLPKDSYHVERDDGEDVLIKKRYGAKDFDLEVVSNSVDGVHINLDRE